MLYEHYLPCFTSISTVVRHVQHCSIGGTELLRALNGLNLTDYSTVGIFRFFTGPSCKCWGTIVDFDRLRNHPGGGLNSTKYGTVKPEQLGRSFVGLCKLENTQVYKLERALQKSFFANFRVIAYGVRTCPDYCYKHITSTTIHVITIDKV